MQRSLYEYSVDTEDRRGVYVLVLFFGPGVAALVADDGGVAVAFGVERDSFTAADEAAGPTTEGGVHGLGLGLWRELTKSSPQRGLQQW